MVIELLLVLVSCNRVSDRYGKGDSDQILRRRMLINPQRKKINPKIFIDTINEEDPLHKRKKGSKSKFMVK